ncbi:MAG: peptidylprolyl isomerase [Paracoccaceae bacterium]|nr:peptidylprolyl isomerase [Paracoccaceae bacterium]
MMRFLSLLAAVAVLVLPLGAPPAQAQANSPFAPVIMVNDLGITGYEIDQRVKFLTLLRQSGDLRKLAEDGLIEDRLRVSAAANMGITLSDKAVADGMSEFAGRANLSTEQFVAELAKGGVEEQTFRDFVRAGSLWRAVIREKYSPRVKITEADIDRALLAESQRGQGTRVLLSEIIIPAPPGEEAAAMAEAQRVSKLTGEGAFGAAARQVSASGSAARGGRLDWMPVANLPPALRSVVLGLAPGQASAPMEIPNAVAVFMLRALDEGGPVTKESQTLEYAQFIAGPAGAPETAVAAARVQDGADRCDDLYGLAKGLPADRLLRETQAQGAIAQDIGLALASMDIGETKLLTRGPNTVVLMLCKRERSLGEGDTAPDRTAVANSLTNARLASYADSYLADLMADAVIKR